MERGRAGERERANARETAALGRDTSPVRDAPIQRHTCTGTEDTHARVPKTHVHVYQRHKCQRTGTRTGRKVGRQAGNHTGRHARTLAHWPTGTQAGRQPGWQAFRKAGTLAGRQACRQASRQASRNTGRDGQGGARTSAVLVWMEGPAGCEPVDEEDSPA